MSLVPQVQRVEFKKRTDLDIHVRAVSALDACEMREQLGGATKLADMLAVQLVAYVVDANGVAKFADAAAAREFMKTVGAGVVKKIIDAGEAFNELSDEAIEEEKKD